MDVDVQGLLYQSAVTKQFTAGKCRPLSVFAGKDQSDAVSKEIHAMTMDFVGVVVWGVVVAAVGAFLTDSLSTWYKEELKKPTWQPPDWAFGPAWSLIFVLASWAFYLGLEDAPTMGSRLLIIGLFILNGLANILWNPLFFRLRRPDWALIETPFLWLSVLAPMLVLWPISGTASLLLIPYLLWVTFAGYLNLTIVRLNRPFGIAAAPAWDARGS